MQYIIGYYKLSFSMLNSGLFQLRKCRLFCNLAVVLAAMLMGTGCSRIDDGQIRGRKAVNAVMDRVEIIMDDDPQTADSLMRLIDANSIQGKKTNARYALLYTAAEYKNYQVVTSDSLIMTAVRYYSIDNNMDYRFLSYYYLGCVYMELHQYSDAGAAFANAEQLSSFVDNDYWKGLLYLQLGDVFRMVCDYYRAQDYYIASKSSFESAAKVRHKLYALLRLGTTKMNNREFRDADSILIIVEKESDLIGDKGMLDECLYNRLSCLIYLNKPDSVTNLLNNYGLIIDESSKVFGYLERIAQYYIEKRNYQKAEYFLDRARHYAITEDDSIYLYYVSSLLAKSKGNTEEALDFFLDYTSLQNDNLKTILSQPILAVQNEQYKMMAENELLKFRHARLTLILCVVIFLLIIVIIIVTYHYKKKRMNEQLYDSLAVVDELSGKIEDLKNQVRIQFRERHDLSNRLYSMYFDSESQDKVTKQQLNVTINSLIKDYTAPDSVRKLDKLLNESYDGIMERLSDPNIGLTDKELELFRYSFAGLSSKAVSIITKESPQNIYQIKSRLLKKVRRCSEELWSKLNDVW